MAAGKGLLAIIGDGAPPKGDDEKESNEPTSAKARALKAMFEAMKEGAWNRAAKHAQEVYDECVLAKEESAEEEDADLFGADTDEEE